MDDEKIVEGCIITKMVNGCGPYAYHVTKENGVQRWRYLGKASEIDLPTLKSKRVGKCDKEEIENE